MKGLHRCAFRDLFLRRGEIAKRGGDVVRRAGDHGGEKTRHAGPKHFAYRMSDRFRRGMRRIVVDAGEAIDLQIDPARGKVVARRGWREQRIDAVDQIVE